MGAKLNAGTYCCETQDSCCFPPLWFLAQQSEYRRCTTAVFRLVGLCCASNQRFPKVWKKKTNKGSGTKHAEEMADFSLLKGTMNEMRTVGFAVPQ